MQVSQPEKQKACKHCQQVFTYKRVTAEFCKKSCQKAHKRASQQASQEMRVYRAESSAFFYWLAAECRRAGSIEILNGHTLESMRQLLDVYKLRSRANEYGFFKDFAICHIFPSSHVSAIGLLRAENLVVSYARLNREYGNSFVQGAGLCLDKASLKPQWMVSEDASPKDVVKKIVAFFGVTFVEILAVELKLKPNKRQQVMDWLLHCSSDLVPTVEVLEAMTTQKLSELKKEISGKSEGYVPSADMSASEVFLHEVRRLTAYRSDLDRVAELWEQYAPCYDRANSHTSMSDKRLHHLQDELELAQFQLLHGGPVSYFIQAVDRFETEFERLSALVMTERRIKDAERIELRKNAPLVEPLKKPRKKAAKRKFRPTQPIVVKRSAVQIFDPDCPF